LEGAWEAIYSPEDADKVPADKRLRIVFKGEWTATFQGQRLLTMAKIKLDPTKSPKRIWHEGDHPTQGIYEVNGDGLRLSVAPLTAEFPTEFGAEKSEFRRLIGDVEQELLKELKHQSQRPTAKEKPANIKTP